jgi:hypothetical protein
MTLFITLVIIGVVGALDAFFLWAACYSSRRVPHPFTDHAERERSRIIYLSE